MKKNYYLSIILLVFIVIFSLSLNAQKSSSEKEKYVNHIGKIKDYAVFYGAEIPPSLKDLKGPVILDYGNLKNPNSIREIKMPICYLSLGEVNENDPALKTLPDECFFLEHGKRKGTIDPNWISYYVNAGCTDFKEYALKRTKFLLSNGCKGIFFDTVDTVDILPAAKEGMINLIKEIRAQNPDTALVQNRGLNIISQTGSYVDVVMWESFATYSGGNKRVFNKQDSDYYEAISKQIASFPRLNVFTLDYGLSNINEVHSLAKKFSYSINYIAPDASLRTVSFGTSTSYRTEVNVCKVNIAAARIGK